MTIEDEKNVGACWECGYSLRGLTMPRCPECGRGFDPADPMTMNMGIEVGPVKRFLMQPPGWPLYVMTGVAALVSVWAAASPTPPGMFVDTLGNPEEWHSLTPHLELPEGRFLWGALLWIVALSIWTFRRVARGVTVSRLSKQKPAAFAYWRRWLWPLVVFAMTVLCCLTQLPVLGGFWLSRSALDAAVKDDRHGRLIGIYPVKTGRPAAVRARAGQEWLYLSKHGGFVHFDAGNVPNQQSNLDSNGFSIRFKRVAEGWYSFRRMNSNEE